MAANYTKRDERAAATGEMLEIIKLSRSLRGVQQADSLGVLVWVFCMRCGHARLTTPRWLIAQVKDAPDRFEALARRLWCDKCSGHGVELIAVPRGLATISPTDASQTSLGPKRV